MMKRGRGRPRKIKIETPSLNLSNGEVPCSDNLPEFFKIYTPTLSSTTMRIPPDFIDTFGESIPTTCTLKMQQGNSQQVGMNRVNGDWFFQEGWPQFVKENSLNDRDFLIFSYIGESRSFLVKIFSPNGCPKVATASHTSRVDDESSDSESEEEEVEVEEEEEAVAAKTKRQRKMSHSRWGNPISFIDDKPCFTIEVTRAYLDRGILRVPLEFWSDYMEKEENGDSRKASLCVGDEKWSVNLGVSPGRAMFRGCLEFLKDNSIKPGNSCTFQLIHPTTFSFKVMVQ